MAYFNPELSLVAIGLKKEASYGTDNSATDTLVSFDREEMEPLEPTTNEAFQDTGVANQSFVPTQTVLLNQKLEGKITDRLTCDLANIVMASCCDTYAVAAVTAQYKHTMRWLTAGAVANYGLGTFISRNVHMKYMDVVKMIGGVVLNGFSISTERGKHAKLSVDVLGCRSFGTAGTPKSWATLDGVHTAAPYLKYNDITFLKGTYTPGNPPSLGSTTDFSAQLIDCTLTYKKTANLIYAFGDTTQYVSRIDPIGHELELTAKFEIQAQTDFFSDWQAQNTYGIKIPIVGPTIAGANKWQIDIFLAKMYIEDCSIGAENGRLIRTVKFKPLGNTTVSDTTQEIMHIEVTNNIANAQI